MCQDALDSARAERLLNNFVGAKEILASLIATFETKNVDKTLLAEVYNELGLVEYMDVNFIEAIQCFSKALDLHGCAAFFYNRGLIYYRLGEFHEAMRDMNHALAIDPEFQSASSCRDAMLHIE